MFLIQNSQETEEALEELRQKLEETKSKMTSETSSLAQQITTLQVPRATTALLYCFCSCNTHRAVEHRPGAEEGAHAEQQGAGQSRSTQPTTGIKRNAGCRAPPTPRATAAT